MDSPSPARLRHKEKAVRGRVRKFKPRLLPRDKYDVRLLIGLTLAITLAVLPIAWAWLLLPALIARFIGFGGLAPLLVLSQTILWLWGAFRALIGHLEVADDGLRVVGGRSRTIPWSDIEAVEPLGRGETVRAMLRWPIWEWNLQMSSGVTLGGYVRIRTKSGTLIFGPENRAQFLNEMHTYLYRENPKVQIPVWQWHEAHAAQSREDVAKVQRVGRSQ